MLPRTDVVIRVTSPVLLIPGASSVILSVPAIWTSHGLVRHLDRQAITRRIIGMENEMPMSPLI